MSLLHVILYYTLLLEEVKTTFIKISSPIFCRQNELAYISSFALTCRSLIGASSIQLQLDIFLIAVIYLRFLIQRFVLTSVNYKTLKT